MYQKLIGFYFELFSRNLKVWRRPWPLNMHAMCLSCILQHKAIKLSN